MANTRFTVSLYAAIKIPISYRLAIRKAIPRQFLHVPRLGTGASKHCHPACGRRGNHRPRRDKGFSPQPLRPPASGGEL